MYDQSSPPTRNQRLNRSLAWGVALLAPFMLAACERQAPAPETVTTAPTSAPAPTTAKVAEPAQNLELARNALKLGQLVAPPGDNAIEYYLLVLDQDEKNVAARQALLELIPPAASAVEGSIASGDIDNAEYQIALLKRMGVSELRVAPLRTALQRQRDARERALAAQSEPVPVPRDTAPAPPQAPPSIEPPRPTVAPTAVVPPPLAASAPPAAGAAISPPSPAPDREAPVAAPTPAPSNPIASVIEEPVQVVDVAPAYPPNAKRQRIEGRVVLEFTITSDGRVEDIEVVGSEPPNIFDREAIRAAQRWRFTPRKIDGVPTTGRGRKALTFRLS